MRITRLMLGLAVLLAIGAALVMANNTDAAEAKKDRGPELTFEFSATFSSPQIATEIVALSLCAANIGSSGEDGVTICPDGTSKKSDFQVDSFFDISYRVGIFGDPDFRTTKTSTVDIEIIALQLTGVDPVTTIDAVRAALTRTGQLQEYHGHVTVLK